MMLDPKLDIEFHRDIAITPAQVWEGWTRPELLKEWFCPRPWIVTECEIDLQPGGIFRSVMQSPDGAMVHENIGTYLAVEPERRLVWTNAMGPGFRIMPQLETDALGFYFVAELTLEPLPNGGTRYSAKVMHQTEAGCEKHKAMGFETGWSLALDQLVELMKARG